MPGDLVMGLTETRKDTSFRYGVIVAIKPDYRESHHGCHTHITVLWSENWGLTEQCDCEILVPQEIGM